MSDSLPEINSVETERVRTRKLALSRWENDGGAGLAPITVEARNRGTITMSLKSGTTPQETRAIDNTPQARVKGLCQLETLGDDAT